MIRRRRFVSRGTRARRRKFVWARSHNNFAGTALAANGFLVIDLLADYQTFAGGDTLNGATIAAIRGTVLPVGTTSAQMSAGVALTVEDVAVATSIAPAQLAPWGAGRYRDWLYRQSFYEFAIPLAAGTTAILPVAGNSVASVVNVRSRRKLEELDSSLFMVVQNGAQAGAFIYDLSIGLMLP